MVSITLIATDMAGMDKATWLITQTEAVGTNVPLMCIAKHSISLIRTAHARYNLINGVHLIKIICTFMITISKTLSLSDKPVLHRKITQTICQHLIMPRGFR